MAKTLTIETTKGTITLELFDKEAPKIVENFETLAAKGFYNGIKFHRVIPNFMVQAGCPQGTGTGGPGYTIDCEIHPSRRHGKGALSMAHTGQCQHDKKSGTKLGGKCTNGSQFFITHCPTPHLDGVHSVFGQVTSGQDVVDKIQGGDKMVKVTVNTTAK